MKSTAPKHLYCLLPSGNRSEFPALDAETNRRKCRASKFDLPGGGRLYRIPAAQVKKLPKDKKGHYLGDDQSGHGIYPMTSQNEFIKQAKGKWKPA